MLLYMMQCRISTMLLDVIKQITCLFMIAQYFTSLFMTESATQTPPQCQLSGLTNCRAISSFETRDYIGH